MAAPAAQVNLYCDLADLSNEASVEQFFVSRMLASLGYRDSQIKPKTSLDKLKTPAGRRRLLYRPDYAISVRKKIRWIIDAKAPNESLEDYVGQCAGYCLNLNQRYNTENPVSYFVLSNGVRTQVYEWDREDPILDLSFCDFVEGNTKYRQFRDLLKQRRFSNINGEIEKEGPTHTLRKRSIGEMNADFAWCHQFIYKKDNLSQSAAFMAFVKIIFLKLLSDRDVRTRYTVPQDADEISIPSAGVKFSKRWIEERESDHPNPLDALQFQSLIQHLETEITSGQRKRIFDQDTHLTLSADTIKGVVERLEDADLYAIDADLNGRLFETFLNATMRGKDLGQYFTPRSIVKLAIKLARLQANRKQREIVIDACCGTGGFLIDVLADMWVKIDQNKSFTSAERQTLKTEIAHERVFGVDVARDPALARIARMNMYLHGDGGSRIYQADALDPAVSESSEDAPELKHEKSELRDLLSSEDGFADVVVTNPPFAKEYQRKYPRDAKILDNYCLAFTGAGAQKRGKNTVKSSLLFLERYHQILKPGGRMVTVLDDSILGGPKYVAVRNFIRENFIVQAIVSLPGDAFQRSKARVKTSLLCVQKKRSQNEQQPPVFMYYCTTVGLDDPSRQRVLPIDTVYRKKAAQEIENVDAAFAAFLDGGRSANKWTVPASAITNRMDVKSCLPKPARNVRLWKRHGYNVIRIGELIDLVEFEPGDVLVTAESDELVTHLRVRYDGFAETGDEIYASDSNYARLFRVHTGQLVMSHIGATYGAMGIVSESLNGAVVTNEYSVFCAKPGIDPRLVWMLVRTPEARADLLMMATGISRNRVQGKSVCDLQLPLPPDMLSAEIIKVLQKAEAQEIQAKVAREEITKKLESVMDLDSQQARTILAAFKPPN